MKRQGANKFYDEEFKINAVRLWKESGKRQRVFEEEMDIGSGNISHWKTQYAVELGDAPKPNHEKIDMEKELKMLRRENIILKEEREILKKAMGIFSKPLR